LPCRMKERPVSGSRGSVILLFVAEGMLVGLLAAVAGTATGFAASRLAVRAFADRVATIASMPVGPLRPSFYWPAAAAGAASGLVASMLGFFLPALFASQRGYAEASVIHCTSVTPPARWRGSPAGGLLAFVLGLATVGLEYKFSLGAIGPVSDAACVIGAALLLPRLVSALGSATEGMLERKMPTGVLLAARNVATASGSAATIAAVALAVCVIVVFATIQRSIGRSIGGWIEDSFVYDLEIASQSIDPGKLVPVHEDLAEGLASVRGVKEVHLVRWIQHDYKGHRITIHSLDYSQSGRPTQRFMVREGDPSGTYAEVAASRGVAVSENFALHLGVGPGDFISLKAPLGLARLKIVAVVVNYNSEEGTVLMSKALFDRYWGDRLVNYFLVMTAKGANLDEVRREIGRRFGRKYDLVILTLGEAKAKIYGIINRIFHFIYALEMLVVVVGFLTIASTVSASVVRRQQQLAICRSFGMSRGQLAGMIAAEAALMGLVSGAVGTILGLVLSVAWVKVHCSRLLGWIVNYSLPGLVVGATLVLTVMVAVIAGCWPAYEAGRIRAADYLRCP